MATAANQPPQDRPQAVPPKRQMREAKAPEQFKFTKQGESISGVLLNIEPTQVNGKDAIEYMLQNDRKDRLTFLGTNDLNKKITAAMIGYYMEIRYERDDDSFQKVGQSAMKVFKVDVSKDKEPGF